MKNRKIILTVCMVTVIIVCLTLILTKFFGSNQQEEENNISPELEKEYADMKENSTMYKDESTIEELKEEYKITGSTDIYQVETEKDGRKVINVKPSINYQVAFCGMIKNSKPTFEELDALYEQNKITENGVWINTSDSEKVLSYLNNNQYLKSKYEINKEGYLQISQKNKQTKCDKQLEEIINGDEQYVISISSIYYMVDTVTGEIVYNPYNDLEQYQTYDYCKDENKMIIFASENKEKKLTDDEIFMSIMELSDLIK